MNALKKISTVLIDYLLRTVVRKKILPLKNIRKILVISNGRLGDALLSMPAIHAIKNAQPQAKITLLVDPQFKELWKNQPLYDDLLEFQAPWLSYSKVSQPWKKTREIIKSIRKAKYDAVIDFRGDVRNMFFVGFLGKIPIRIGHTYSGSALLTHAVPYAHQHEVENAFAIARLLGGKKQTYRFFIPEKEKVWAKTQTDTIKKPRAILFPTPGYSSKAWLNKRWGAVAKNIPHSILLAGAKGDENTQEISALIEKRVYNFTGKVSLNQLAALINEVDIAIGVDTGTMHLSAFIGTKTITLFGPTDPIRWKPYGKGEIVKKETMKDITVKDVLEKL